MKASEYIEKHGDFEITEEMEKCIPCSSKSVWDLQYGDMYYLVDFDYDRICPLFWKNHKYEKNWRKYNLVFTDEKEALFKLESMKVYEELKRFAKEFTNEEWLDTRIKKIFIYFSCPLSRIQFASNLNCKCHDLYFESEEKAEEAIEAVGEERVKKYYLGVGK